MRRDPGHACGLAFAELLGHLPTDHLHSRSAGIVPAVLDGQSQPLDLGRRKRLFSEAQALALGLRFTTCAADGCERPFARCELHHQQAWSRQGRTDRGNALPLCGFHHRRIHDPSYLHRRLLDGSIRFHART